MEKQLFCFFIGPVFFIVHKKSGFEVLNTDPKQWFIRVHEDLFFALCTFFWQKACNTLVVLSRNCDRMETKHCHFCFKDMSLLIHVIVNLDCIVIEHYISWF